MHVRILGPVAAEERGDELTLGGRRERAVLAALGLRAGRTVPSDVLSDALWGEQPPATAAKTLQNYVLRLRKVLGGAVIETVVSGYRLAVPPVVVDVAQFQAGIRAGRHAIDTGAPDRAVGAFRDALGLWRGRPLEEIAGWAEADIEVARLEELHRGAQEDLVGAELDCGRHAEAVAELEAMVADQPLRERRWAMLMLALYRSGRQTDALRAYQRARGALVELGIDPGSELRALDTAIAAQDPALNNGRGRILVDTQGEADHDETARNAPPYKGLEPFGVGDRDVYFGRAGTVAALVERLRGARFLAIVGSSGAGKSSLLRAGVMGALADDAIAGSRDWPVVAFRPGEHPIAALAHEVATVTTMPVDDVVTKLSGDVDALDELARSALGPRRDARVVIAIDQFEEVFTRCTDPREREQFVALLTYAVDPGAAACVLLATRADFVGRLAEFGALAGLLERGTALLGPMRSEELRATIEAPARVAGVRLEPGLVDIVLRDVGEEPGGLPLLSHALLETWKRRRGDTLTVAGYRDAGGVRSAIAHTADGTYDAMTPAQQALARAIFLRLVEPGIDTADARRRATRNELNALGDADDIDATITALADARLVTVHGDSLDLAHEALLREWPRLRSWLDEDRESLRIQRHLTRAATEWDDLDRDPAELYRGSRLALVRTWLEDSDVPPINELERVFVAAGIAQEESAHDALRQEARRKERDNRRLRSLLVATAAVLVIALVAGAIAVVQRSRASHDARRAERASDAADVTRLVSQSNALQPENRYLGALLAVEANDLRDDAQTRGALLSALVSEPRRVRTIPTGTSSGVWLLQGGHQVLVRSGETLNSWDVATGKRINSFPLQHVTSAAVSSRGLVAVDDADGVVHFFDANGRRQGVALRTGLPSPQSQLAFSPDGALLGVAAGIYGNPATHNTGQTAQLFDVATGNPHGGRLLGHSGGANAIAFNRDGTVVATGGPDDRVVLHDVATGAPIGAPIEVGGPVWRLQFDPVRDRLAIGTAVPGLTVVDTANGNAMTFGRIVADPQNEAIAPQADPSYTPDGRELVVTSNGVARRYDAATLAVLPGTFAPETSGAHIAFVDATRFVVGGDGVPATVWDDQGRSALDRAVTVAPTYVFPVPGGKVLAAPDLEDSVALIDARTLAPLGPPLSPGPGHATAVGLPATFAASYYDGHEIAVVNRDGRMRRYDVSSRRSIGAPYDLHMQSDYAVYSRNMHEIAVGGRQGEVALVDLRTQRVRRLSSAMNNYVFGLEFSPDGALYASDAGHVVRFDHLDTDHPRTRDITARTSSSGWGMDLSSDGRVLAVSSGSDVLLFDAQTLRAIGGPIPATGNRINWIAFNRAGTQLVAGDAAYAARLIDVRSRTPLGPALFIPAGSGAVFSHDGRTLGTLTPYGGALMDLDPHDWRTAACELAGRNLTKQEWARYLPGAHPHALCPEFPYAN